MPTRKTYDPAAAPHLVDRVCSDEARGDAGPDRRTGGPERRYRADAEDKDHIKYDVHHRHHNAEDHRGLGVARRAQRAARHKINKQADAENKCDAKKRQSLGLDTSVRAYKIKQIRSHKISDRCHYADREKDRGKKSLIDRAVYLLLVVSPRKSGDKNAHSGKKR